MKRDPANGAPGVVIFQWQGHRVESYGNGLCYTLFFPVTGQLGERYEPSVFLQGDDAESFRKELDQRKNNRQGVAVIQQYSEIAQ